MAPKIETLPHDGGFIVSELGTYSREIITIVSGQNLQAGAVLGKITASGKYTAYDNGASDGEEAAAGVLFGDIDATDGDVEGTGFLRGPGELHEGRLVFDSGQDGAAIAAGKVDLVALDFILRS